MTQDPRLDPGAFLHTFTARELWIQGAKHGPQASINELKVTKSGCSGRRSPPGTGENLLKHTTGGKSILGGEFPLAGFLVSLFGDSMVSMFNCRFHDCTVFLCCSPQKIWDQLQDMYQLPCLWQDGSSWCIAPFQLPSISCHQIQELQRLLPNSSIATSFDCWVVRDQSGFKWTCLGRKNQGLKQDQFIPRKKNDEIEATGVLKSTCAGVLSYFNGDW